MEHKGETIWDYSTLSCFQTCRKKYYFRYVRHLAPKTKSPALHFGTLIHECLDIYYQKGIDDALTHFRENYVEPKDDSLRTFSNGIELLLTYADRYKEEPFKVIGMPEKSFIYPIGDFLYAGKIDMLVEWSSELWVMEHKTTTRLNASYFFQFELDKQITGYILAAEAYSGRKCSGCILNALEPWKQTIRPSKKAPHDHFARSLITRSKRLRDRFIYNVQCIIRDIKWCVENGEFQEAEKKEACFYYNRKCPYFELCMYGEDERLINRDFNVEPWNPMEQNKQTNKKEGA